LVCINDINENQFVSNLTNNNIWIGLFRDPATCQFRWLDCMDITFTNWRPGEPNSDPCGEPYTQIIRGCSFGLNTWNNLNDISTNGNCYSDMVPIMEIDPSIYNTSPINPTTTYLWSTGETTATINPTPLTTTTYWIDVTTNGATCRKSITITVKNTPAPTGDAKQQFCNDSTIAALAVNGTALKWYESATGTTALNNTTALANETTYFATQTIDGCESTNRFQTTVSIQKVPTPTGDGIQKFCLEGNPVISNLIARGNSILWFDAITNGMAIDKTTLLQDNTTYYATTLDAATGCESLQRLAVKVDLFKCDITAYNLITINGNSLNDQLTFEDISYFPDNSVKIYNRYGKLVWETTGYDNTNNAFKGKANVSGVYMKDSFLPAGTYFFILVYNNTYINKQTELTGYLQIDNVN
jgi:gliding motility-associated-like protein